MSGSSKLTHFDKDGRAVMVDVGGKAVTTRDATATGLVTMSRDTFNRMVEGRGAKGNVMSVAELAGIMGAKRTSDLIPLCHPLAINSVKVDIEPDANLPGVSVSARVKTDGKTGVEMEALTAVSIACLTIYDMLKAVDKAMVIGNICLQEKTGGKSGTWTRPDETS